jgi:osmotically-inducible protein OsmY
MRKNLLIAATTIAAIGGGTFLMMSRHSATATAPAAATEHAQIAKSLAVPRPATVITPAPATSHDAIRPERDEPAVARNGAAVGHATDQASPAATPQLAQMDDVQVEQVVGDAIRRANVSVRSLIVRKAGDIVVLRGTGDSDASLAAVRIAKSLGVTRVASLITPAGAIDDDAIRRDVERSLARNRAFDGCRIFVKCENGVVSVSGTVQNEMQKDAARQALRSVSGAKEVRVTLTTG